MVHQISRCGHQILLNSKWSGDSEVGSLVEGRTVDSMQDPFLFCFMCHYESLLTPSLLSDLCVWQKLCWIGSKQKQLRKWASGEDLQRGFSTNQRRLDGTRSAVHCQDPAPLLLAQAAQGLACLQKSYTSHSYKHKHAHIHNNSLQIWFYGFQMHSINSNAQHKASLGQVVTRVSRHKGFISASIMFWVNYPVTYMCVSLAVVLYVVFKQLIQKLLNIRIVIVKYNKNLNIFLLLGKQVKTIKPH